MYTEVYVLYVYFEVYIYIMYIYFICINIRYTRIIYVHTVCIYIYYIPPQKTVFFMIEAKALIDLGLPHTSIRAVRIITFCKKKFYYGVPEYIGPNIISTNR